MRLFVGLWPPPAVCEVLAGLSRRDHPSVRWTTPDQWHATLCFLGDVEAGRAHALVDLLGSVGQRHAPRLATLGPATTRLGRGALVVPVSGIDDLGPAVAAATGAAAGPHARRLFSGHVTLARGRGRRPVPVELTGEGVCTSWPVRELSLVRSHLEPRGARYETIGTVALTGPAPGGQPVR